MGDDPSPKLRAAVAQHLVKIHGIASSVGLGSGNGAVSIRPGAVAFAGDFLTRRSSPSLDVTHTDEAVVVVNARLARRPVVLLHEGERYVSVTVSASYERVCRLLHDAGFSVETVKRSGFAGSPKFTEFPQASDPWAPRPNPLEDPRVFLPALLVGGIGAGVAASLGGTATASVVVGVAAAIVGLVAFVAAWF